MFRILTKNRIVITHSTVQGLGLVRFVYAFERCLLSSPTLFAKSAFILSKILYIKNSNVVKYYYSLKLLFSIWIF